LGWKVLFFPDIRVVHLRGASSTQKSFIDFTGRQFKAKLQFVREHYGARQSRYYKKLIKAVALQRFLLYFLISVFLPLTKYELRKRQAYLYYIAAKNSIKTL